MSKKSITSGALKSDRNVARRTFLQYVSDRSGHGDCGGVATTDLKSNHGKASGAPEASTISRELRPARI
jgi:hypothetical protein